MCVFVSESVCEGTCVHMHTFACGCACEKDKYRSYFKEFLTVLLILEGPGRGKGSQMLYY